MKRVLSFAQAFIKEAEAAITPEMKRTLCEDAKAVIAATMNGPWATLATSLINDLEKTIKA